MLNESCIESCTLLPPMVDMVLIIQVLESSDHSLLVRYYHNGCGSDLIRELDSRSLYQVILRVLPRTE
jgi:hypothetical protein